MKRLTTIIAMLLTILSGIAQNESTFEVQLDASNGLTMERLKAKFYIMTPDSVVVDSCRTAVFRLISNGNETVKLAPGKTTFKSVPGKEYIVKVSSEGFETEFFPLTLPLGKKREVDMTNLKLFPVPSAKDLEEFVVTHSRVKMVMKGDTIVFDAAKFQLAHGDMLSAMVRQMEGLTIENGVIKMNGRTINDLLINGESFFKGDPSVALNNLPAFTVRNIKFYEKDPDDAYLTGPQGDEKDYVLDVTLKKEYVSGYLGNIEGGYGTAGRYIGRGFGLGFGQNFRLAAYVNANNIQNVQTATASSSGDWESRGSQSEGDAHRQLGGIDYIFNPNKELKIKGNAKINHTDQDFDRIVSTTNFLEGGDTYGRQTWNRNIKDLSLSTSHELQLSKKKLFLKFNPEISYGNKDGNTTDLNALFSRNPLESKRGEAVAELFGNDPSEREKDLIYRLRNLTLGNDKKINTSASLGTKIKFSDDSEDYLMLDAKGSFSKATAKSRQDYALLYANPAEENPDNVFDRFGKKDSKNWDYELHAGYEWKTEPDRHDIVWSIKPHLYFNDSYDNNNNYLYPLTGLNLSGTGLSIALTDEIQAMIDRQNSYWSDEHTLNGKGVLEMQLVKSKKLLSVNLALTANWQRGTLDYNKPDFFQRAKRNDFLPGARLTANYNISKKKYTSYGHIGLFANKYSPNLTYTIDTSNTSDPLNIQMSNPDLKNWSMIGANYSFGLWVKKLQLNVNIYGYASFYLDRVVKARDYNPASGATIWTPMNMDGNRDYNYNISATKELGKGFSAYMSYSQQGNRSVEMLTSPAWSGRNIVTNIQYEPSAGFDYELAGKLNINITYAHSLNKGGYGYNGSDKLSYRQPMIFSNITYTMPWKMKLISNFRAKFNGGYSDPAMNETSLQWTLRLSQPFFKDKLIATLAFSDVLNRQRNIFTKVNAYSMTETWQAMLPRYVMLTLAYKFNINPKK